MTFPSHPSPVPLFQSLESGTMEQILQQRNSPRNEGGTCSLKALANKVLEQNKMGNKPGTEASNSVPPLPQSSIACGTNAEVGCTTLKRETIFDDFEERLAIAEYDGQQTPVQAERIAYLDAFVSVLVTLPHKDYEGDWLGHRIIEAKKWLLDQGMGQPKSDIV